MEFSQFRDTGELSDLLVNVEGKDFKLHKFPLFIKSDFFRALARAGNIQEKIVLEDFPGGATTFEDVANFCYNIRIEVNRNNICELRCAAEFLQMGSRGNLVDTTDRHLVDMLTSAKLSRDFDLVADLLVRCKALGEISEQAKIVDKCLIAIVDCLLLSTKYNKHAYVTDVWAAGPKTREKIFQIPLAWFVDLFKCARDKCVRPALLADLVQSYINYVIDGKVAENPDLASTLDELAKEVAEPAEQLKGDDEGQDEVDDEDDDEEVDEEKETKDEQSEEVANDESESPAAADEENDDDEAEDAADAEATPVEQAEQASDPAQEEATAQSTDAATDDRHQNEAADDGKETNVDESSKDAEEEDNAASPTNKKAKETNVDEIPVDDAIATALDALIPEMPDHILMAEYLSPHWAMRVLRVAEANDCKCTDHVRKLVSRVVYRLAPEDLVQMPADMLTDIVREACKDTQGNNQQMACALVDTYLSELSQRDQLTVETFTKMIDVVPADYRLSHDTLFEVLETLLKSESIKLTDEQKQTLLESIDYSRLSESALLRAYETELVPQAYITRAALELCGKLRQELQEAKHIIITQERELEKLNALRFSSHYSKPRAESKAVYRASAPARRRDPLSASSYVTSSHYVSPSLYSSALGVPTLASDAELQMVLDSLDKTSERDCPLRNTDPYPPRSSMPYTPVLDDRETECTDAYSQSLPPYRGLYYKTYKY